MRPFPRDNGARFQAAVARFLAGGEPPNFQPFRRATATYIEEWFPVIDDASEPLWRLAIRLELTPKGSAAKAAADIERVLWAWLVRHVDAVPSDRACAFSNTRR